jgi:hypothetical protein
VRPEGLGKFKNSPNRESGLIQQTFISLDNGFHLNKIEGPSSYFIEDTSTIRDVIAVYSKNHTEFVYFQDARYPNVKSSGTHGYHCASLR